MDSVAQSALLKDRCDLLLRVLQEAPNLKFSIFEQYDSVQLPDSLRDAVRQDLMEITKYWDWYNGLRKTALDQFANELRKRKAS